MAGVFIFSLTHCLVDLHKYWPNLSRGRRRTGLKPHQLLTGANVFSINSVFVDSCTVQSFDMLQFARTSTRPVPKGGPVKEYNVENITSLMSLTMLFKPGVFRTNVSLCILLTSSPLFGKLCSPNSTRQKTSVEGCFYHIYWQYI